MGSSSEDEPRSGSGKVGQLKAEFSLFEDGALARRMQDAEISSHLRGNRQRNRQIRGDYPKALLEQSREMNDRRCRDEALRKLEGSDAEFARMLQQTDGRTTRTPPLPVTLDGDVPFEEEKSFHDLKGGIHYEDHSYLVKTARPAVVKAEPLYANNQPEHYASAEVAPESFNESPVAELLGATGLSQKDLATSRKALALIEQEKRDLEIAKQLQVEFEMGSTEAEKIEAMDHKLAAKLHEKDRAKLKRAKERSRLKKQQLLQQQQQPGLENNERISEIPPVESRRSESRQEEIQPPARRPYLNHEAIESATPVASSCCSESGSDNKDTAEPQYENIGRNNGEIRHLPKKESSSESPVPPYMPLQQSNCKKSHSLEKRINKKKEGCKQQ